MKELFIGTTNPYKVREIGAILTATGFSFKRADPQDPEETGDTFEENALIKAQAYAEQSGGATISEDSGLIVPALGGLPGPWSARFDDYEDVDVVNGKVTGYKPSSRSREEIDRANNEKVLRLMQGIEQPHRAAVFRVSLIVAEPDAVLFSAIADCHGWIAEEPRGANGFGYDPIFIGQDTFGRTFAELDSARKNLKSHRRKVLQELKAFLADMIKKRGGST